MKGKTYMKEFLLISTTSLLLTGCLDYGSSGANSNAGGPHANSLVSTMIAKAGDNAIDCGSPRSLYDFHIDEINDAAECATDAFYLYQPFYVEFTFELYGPGGGIIYEAFSYDGEKLYRYADNYYGCLGDGAENCNFYYYETECVNPIAVDVDRDEDLFGSPFEC